MNPFPTPDSPYKGLAPFEDSEVDALLFFGRDRDSQVVAANLMASRVTVLFGPTGVGKTSLLRAGVAYRLRRESGVDIRIHSSWIGDPGDALANLSPRTGSELYLMLDQFEEFFLYHEGDRVFASQLAEVIRRPDLRVNVLIGIREDSLASLDAFKAIIPNLLSNRLRLENLDRAGGEAAIRGPLDRFNEFVGAERRVEVETDLVTAVLHEVATGRVEIGSVGRGVVGDVATDDRIEAPYLQLVMARLWEVEAERESKLLRRETLSELGGAARIVEDHLEHAMADLSPKQKDAAAAMYNFLVTPSGSKIAHAARDLAGYADISEQDAMGVLRQLAAERIVRASSDNGVGTRYEIYHDVLADAVAAWRGRYQAERSVHEAERRRRRALGLAAASLVGLVLVATIAIFALVERSHSRADSRRARARELAASAGRVLPADPQRGLALALQAALLEPGVHEEDVLRQALTAANERSVMRADGPVPVARFDPSGGRIVTASRDGKVRVYVTGSSRPTLVMSQGAPVTAAEYSTDGRSLLTGGRNGQARLWSAKGKLRLTLHAGAPLRTAFFAVGARAIVTLADGGLIQIWRSRDGKQLVTIKAVGKALPKRAAVDPLGRFLVTVGQDRFARVYSFSSGRLLRLLPQSGLVHCANFDPTGGLVVTCGHEGVARVWSAVSGVLIRRLRGPGPKSPITDAVFASNGIHVGAAVVDNTARVWEAPTGFQVGAMFGHTAPVTQVAFSPTGRSLVTGSLDKTARTWVVNGRPLSVLSGHSGPLTAVEFSPDSRYVLTASQDGSARLWDSGTEPELRPIATQTPITAFAVSEDGTRLIVGDAKGIARVRAVGRAHVLRTLHVRGRITAVGFAGRRPVVATRPTLSLAVRGDRIARGTTTGDVILTGRRGRRVLATHGGPVTAVAFDGAAALLVTGSKRGTTSIWDLATGHRLHTLGGRGSPITSVALSPDGLQLLTASIDHDVRLWNVRAGTLERIFRWHVGPVNSAAFSRDGHWIVTAGPGTAGVGEISSDQRVRGLRGPQTMRPLVGAAFAGRDGRSIVAASKDGTIRMYRCDFCGDIDALIQLARRRLSLR